MMPSEMAQKKAVLWALLGACCLGLLFRFAFVWEVGRHPSLNVYLSQSDLYNYDLMAKDLLREQPLGLRMIGYPFFIHYLKIFYQVLGTSPLLFYLHQYLLGLFSVFLLYRIGCLHWSKFAGLAAALVYSLYKMNYFYDALRIHTAISQFLIIAVLYFFCLYRKNDSIYSYAGFVLCGVLLGLIRAFLGLIVLGGLVFLFFHKKQWRQRAYFVVIVLGLILSVTGFHRLHSPDAYGHKFGVHFYIGNHAGTIGLFKPLEGVRTHAQGFYQDTLLKAYQETGQREGMDHYWLKKTLDSYRGAPLEVIRTLRTKINLLVNNYEPHNHASVYFYEYMTSLKHYPRLDFGLILAFAVLGMMCLFRNKAPGRYLLVPFAAVLLMIFSVFFCSRYRMPAMPFFCLFAGYGIQQLIVSVRLRQYAVVVGLVAAGALTLFWSYQKMPLLDQGRDIAFWQEKDAQRRRAVQIRQRAQGDYLRFERLSPEQRIFVTKQLGESGLMHEFFDVIDATLKQAWTRGDRVNYVYLLSLKASLLEEAFLYDQALEVWRQLQAYPTIHKIVDKKISDLTKFKTGT